jgi:hypothetical protein
VVRVSVVKKDLATGIKLPKSPWIPQQLHFVQYSVVVVVVVVVVVTTLFGLL